jgi:hypothetical protein
MKMQKTPGAQLLARAIVFTSLILAIGLKGLCSAQAGASPAAAASVSAPAAPSNPASPSPVAAPSPTGQEIAPVLLGVAPSVVYPTVDSAGNAVVSITLMGTRLSAADDILIKGNAIAVCWASKINRCAGNKAIGTASADGRTIQLEGIWVSELSGPITVKVAHDSQISDEKQLVISQVSSSTPLISAIVFAAAIALLISLIVSGLRRREIDGRRYALMTAFLLDPDTYTYSLSKFQFYIWTAAAVLAYAYVALCRSLVQGNLEFIDVPNNLPGILLISAGTFGVATGVTAAKGSKGAGQIQPSWSDLLTTGGVVVPERVQFLVWTMVGVAAFLALTLFVEASKISALPAIPTNFLALQGISAAGYLGGKIARSQGPVITSATGTGAAPPMSIDIIGQGLSIRPGIRIDDQKITYETAPGTLPSAVGVLEILAYDDRSLDKSFATQLKLRITDAATVNRLRAGLVAGTPLWRELSVTNPDGQSAVSPLMIS